MNGKVLVVDDDPALAEMLGIVLRGEGLEPAFVADGDAALGAFRREKPDLVLLDLMLPGTDGVEVCRQIRAESGVPIVMLTARGDTLDVVLGLESGADDYVVKPFALEEVAARLHALLRRRPAGADAILTVGPLVLNPQERRAARDGRDLALTRREFDLLHLFLRHPGSVLDRRRLHEEIWGYTFDPGTNVADVFVGYLRRKLEAGGEERLLHTVRGVGFVLRL